MGTQSVERALLLLEAFTDQAPEHRISELVAFSGLGQSTVSRLVGALDALGFLERDARSGLYRVGHRAVALGALALNSSPIYTAARQVAQNVAAQTGLGVNVALQEGAELFYVCHFEGAAAPKNYDMAGRTGYLHATGLGKCLLSDQDEDDVRALLGTSYAACTPRTITTLDALTEELRTIRGRGYATEHEELAFGRSCIAAPIRDRSQQIVAAVSISGPLTAINLAEREAELAGKVIETADSISGSLGFLGSVAASQPPMGRFTEATSSG
ncbi:IclR family transcriptional regulator [Ruania suaedae]|uniref:IclR family transcriptional regulator n=1 Tax=Ruania suaedae TaxID=2897774 RepID=UPI001E4BC0D2|nr:IclR family transcriptional regulator [Ruania suaedae]UFU02856.1 IclR family transcriptional regulator [Ruania suaedae]